MVFYPASKVWQWNAAYHKINLGSDTFKKEGVNLIPDLTVCEAMPLLILC